MRLLSFCLLFILFISRCDGETRNRRAARGDDYVSAPNHLYFQNIRSRDYRAVTPEEGTVIYHHDNLDGPSELLLIEHWLEDRAELRTGDRALTRKEVQALRQELRSGKSDRFADDRSRAAALEVVEDYLRLTGN